MDAFFSIKLDKESPDPLYRQLYSGLLRLIEAEAVRAGAKLPPIRKMADALGINPTTVVSAYKLLERKRAVESEAGSGTYVAARRRKETQTSPPADIDLKNAIDFAGNRPNTDAFPVGPLEAVFHELLAEQAGGAFMAAEQMGDTALRQTVLELTGRKGASPEQVAVTSGAYAGLQTLFDTLLKPGDCVVLEKPKRQASRLLIPDGVNVKEVNLSDADRLSGLVKAHKPALLWASPVLQNPAGTCLSLAAKATLLELARDCRFIIVEELPDIGTPSAPAAAPLSGMVEGERVIQAGNLTGLALPGISMGFLILPVHIAEQFSADAPPDIFLQRAVCRFMRSEMGKGHIASVSETLKRRMTALKNAVDTRLAGLVSYEAPAGGHWLWLRLLHQDADSAALCGRLISEGVLASPGAMFGSRGEFNRWLRLSCANVPAPKIEEGVEIIRKTILSIQGW